MLATYYHAHWGYEDDVHDDVRAEDYAKRAVALGDSGHYGQKVLDDIKAEAAAKAAEEKRRQDEAERRRKAEEERRRKEEEERRRKVEEALRRKAEVERRRKAEKEEKEEKARRWKAEEERRRKEEEERRRKVEEARRRKEEKEAHSERIARFVWVSVVIVYAVTVIIGFYEFFYGDSIWTCLLSLVVQPVLDVAFLHFAYRDNYGLIGLRLAVCYRIFEIVGLIIGCFLHLHGVNSDYADLYILCTLEILRSLVFFWVVWMQEW